MSQTIINNENPIYQAAHRLNRRTLLVGIGSLVIPLLLFILLSLPYFLRLSTKPHLMNEADLLQIPADTQNIYWVTVEGEATFDTNSYEYTTENGQVKSIDAYFGLLAVGDSVLYIRTPYSIDEQITRYTGTITIPQESSREIYDDLLTQIPDLDGVILPVMLDAANTGGNYFVGVVLLVIVVIGGIGHIIVGLRRANNISLNPVLRKLRPLGDPAQIADQIYKEQIMNGQSITKTVSGTRNWLLYHPSPHFHAARFDDLMWVFGTQITMNFVVKLYTVEAFDRYGRRIFMSTDTKEELGAILQAVAERAPWVVMSNNDKIKKAWEKDRANFIASVDARRKQMSQ